MDLNREVFTTLELSVRPLTSALPVSMKLAILGCFEEVLLSTTLPPTTSTETPPEGEVYNRLACID